MMSITDTIIQVGCLDIFLQNKSKGEKKGDKKGVLSITTGKCRHQNRMDKLRVNKIDPARCDKRKKDQIVLDHRKFENIFLSSFLTISKPSDAHVQVYVQSGSF